MTKLTKEEYYKLAMEALAERVEQLQKNREVQNRIRKGKKNVQKNRRKL